MSGNKLVPKHLRVAWLRFLRLNKFFIHPIFIFVVLQIVSIGITVLWVVWYANKKNIKFGNHYDLELLITGCILMGIILVGTVLLFVFAIKQSNLNKQQHSFVSSVTHELRSPIASVQLSLETLANQHLDQDTQAKVVSMMHADLDRLVNLVDQILVSARLDRGIKIFDHMETFKLREIVDQSLESVMHLDKNLMSRVSINCSDNIQMESAKPALRLVLNNLLENAVKYSPQDAPIEITCTNENGTILLSVHDQGFGLEKAELKKIFKIFRRGDLAVRKAISGTGLGLYIVNAVVRVLSGRVWAESRGRGMGTTFYISLPEANEVVT